MANIKISQLPSVTTPLGGTEVLPIVQGATTKKVTVNELRATAVTAVTGTAGRITSSGGTTPAIDLASGIATPGTTGSSTLVPVVTVDTYGRVTSITTAANPQGTVTGVTATAPVVSSGGAAPVISMAAATASVNGYLTSTDWNTFNNKQPAGSYLTNGGALGTPSSGTLTNTTGLPLSTGVTGTLPVGNGGTGATILTGVLKGNGTSAFTAATAGTDYVAPGGALGTPSSGTLTNVTGLPLSTGVTGTLAVANGGTGQTSYTDGQLLIGNTATGGLSKATLTAGTNVSITNGNGTITIAATGGSGGGDVSGPASATNNAVVLFDGTTGKLIKDSTQTIATANTASTVVARDASGNFSAGTITAALSGNATTATTATNVSGGTASVTTLSASGVATFSAGTVSAPAITTSGDTNTGIFFPAADTIAFSEGGVEAMRLDAAGNVGIGVTPSAWGSDTRALQISSRTSIADLQSTTQLTNNGFWNGSNWVYRETAAVGNYFINGNTHVWRYAASGTAGTAITFSEAMRIDSSGNLLVGTTSSSFTTVGTRIQPNNNDPVITTTCAASTGGATTYNLYSTGASAFRFYVNLAGTIFATSTTISAISDQRLKENVQDLDVGLDKIMALKPRKFDWKAGKGKNIKGDRGWIAQEFEQVFPDMIDTWKDPAPEGDESYKSVRADLIPVLVKAIQEQQAMIEQLKADVAVLKGTV